MAKLDYKNNVILNSTTPQIVGNNTATIQVAAEIKLFREKYSYGEDEDLTKGDDFGFTIVFGNYGELTWTQPVPNIPTLEDTIQIAIPIRLKLMSLSLPCNYQVWIVARNGVKLTNPRQLNECDILESGQYTIQLRKLVNGVYTEFFDIPCHSSECFSLLFQVEFTSCPSCPNECTTIEVSNGDFEALPHNVASTVTNWNVKLPVTGNPFAKTVNTVTLGSTTYNPVSGSYFALLKTDGHQSYTSISQTIEVCPGDTIQGYSFFYTPETSIFVNDNAKVEILDANNQVISTPYYRDVAGGGTTNWEKWSYTFTTGGIYTVKAGVTNFGDDIYDSYMGVDKVEIV